MRQRRVLSILGLAGLLAGCPKARLAPALAPPPPIHVPLGCEADLSGQYTHARDSRYRYLAYDDGGSLTLSLELGRLDAGALEQDAGACEVVIALARTGGGFIGATNAGVFNAAGHACEVSFPTELLACADGGLLLKSAANAAIDDACRAADAGGPMLEQRLVRAARWPGQDGGA